MYSTRLKTPLHWNRQSVLKADYVFCFYCKRNICTPARALQRNQISMNSWASYSNSAVLKMAAVLIKYMWRLTSFYFDACFFFIFLFVWTTSNGYKIHFVNFFFFIVGFKFIFTCYFVCFFFNKVLFIKKNLR